MARPNSEDKRNAILEAAITVFADRGLGAATSAISKAAGIADGTLFTYFSTKDELVNAVYRDIKVSLADAMMSSFPRKKTVRLRLQHMWTEYLDWGAHFPAQAKVLRQIQVWDGLTRESNKVGLAPFLEIEKMMEEAGQRRIIQDLPQRFIAAAMNALADAVVDLARQDSRNAATYRTAGFGMLWGGIVRK